MRADIDHPIEGSWSHHDHVRHFMYESIFGILQKQVWDRDSYSVLEIGTREDTSSIMRMFFNLLGTRCHPVIGNYPEVDIQRLPYVKGFDVVIADQVLEHVERPWLGAGEIHRVTKTGGLAIVATPFILPIHPNPLDCWRIAPDGYKVLFPDALWETLILDSWGNREIVTWEYLSPVTQGMSGEWMTVKEAMREPAYSTPSDGLHPIVIWWIGRKR